MNPGLHDVLIGTSSAIVRLRRLIEVVAPSDLPVLIQGPTGAGKEVAAHALHAASGRRGPLVATNICAVPETMVEEELFGHDRGAYTGAVGERVGYVEEANEGTLLLDEMGSLSRAVQTKLLRVLDTHTFRRLGSARDRTSTFRLVCATNESLDQGVRDHRVRLDLYQRIAGVKIDVPPLVDHLEDLPALVEHFVVAAASRRLPVREFTSCAFRRLARHTWPGNVRELLFVVERALVLGTRDTVDGNTIEWLIGDSASPEHAVYQADELLHGRLVALLARHQGRTGVVAQELGVDRSTIYRWMRRFCLATPTAATRNTRARRISQAGEDVRANESGRMTLR